MHATCLLPCLLFTFAATLAAQSYTLKGEGCNGGPVNNCVVQNDVGPSLRIQSLPNEYAYAARNPTAATIWVVGFEVFTASVSGTPATVLSGLYLDNGGPAAITHSSPALVQVATGRLNVAGPTAWYSTSIYPPIAIGPGVAFWLGAEAITVYPPDSTTGAPGLVASQWRRPPQGATAWAATTLVLNPVFRVHCASGTMAVPALLASNTPRLGQAFNLQLTQGVPNTAGFLVMALNDTLWLAFPTPVNLSLFGAPDCFNYTSTDTTQLAVLDGTGAAAVVINVPNNAGLNGFPFFNQWAALAPGANALNLLVSNYGAGVVGP